ncbi:hypothetical protein QOT17_016423 [Balamuthia mandrillaris]
MQMRGLFVLAVAIGIVFTAETLAQNSCGGLARITETTTLRSDCSGSHASGFVDEQTISSHITASAEGAHAHGYVNDATIIADDSGAIALGFASSGGQILSSADGSIAAGYGTSLLFPLVTISTTLPSLQMVLMGGNPRSTRKRMYLAGRMDVYQPSVKDLATSQRVIFFFVRDNRSGGGGAEPRSSGVPRDGLFAAAVALSVVVAVGGWFDTAGGLLNVVHV